MCIHTGQEHQALIQEQQGLQPLKCWQNGRLSSPDCVWGGSIGKKQERAVAQVVKHLFSKCKAKFNPQYYKKKKKKNDLGVVVHSCTPSTQDTEVEGSQVRGQSELCSETLSKNNEQTHKLKNKSCLPDRQCQKL
jgi:hypothetical protein